MNDKKYEKALTLAKAWMSSVSIANRCYCKRHKAMKPNTLAEVLVDNGLENEPLDSMLPNILLMSNDYRDKDADKVIFSKDNADIVCKAYKNKHATGVYPAVLLSYAEITASHMASSKLEYSNIMKTFASIACSDDIMSIIPKEQDVVFEPRIISSPKVDDESFAVPYRELLMIQPDMHTLHAIGYCKLARLMRMMSAFPLQQYGIRRKKMLDEVASLTDEQFDWLMLAMQAIRVNKPSIKGGINADWVRANYEMPVEFVIENENMNSGGGLSTYDDNAKECIDRLSEHNSLLAVNMRIMLGQGGCGITPSPAMVGTNNRVIEMINNLDTRIITTFPMEKNQSDKLKNTYHGYGYWTAKEYCGFNVYPRISRRFIGSLTPRQRVMLAKKILKNEDTAYRWAVISNVYKYLEIMNNVEENHLRNIGITKFTREELSKYERARQAVKKKYGYFVCDSTKKSKPSTDMPEKIKDYVNNGSRLEPTIIVSSYTGEFEIKIKLPQPLVQAVNAMPSSVDGLPDDKTGSTLFIELLEKYTGNLTDDDTRSICIEYLDEYKKDADI